MINTQTLRHLGGALLLLFLLNACEKPPVEVIDDPLLKEQYFVFSIGGLGGFAAIPNDTVDARRSGGITYLTGIKAGGDPTIRAHFNSDALAGTYPASRLQLFVNNRYYVPTNTPVQVFVSQYGSVGSFIEGSYNGQLKDSLSGVLYTLSGVFKIRRSQ